MSSSMKTAIEKISGKTIAIVYIFEGEGSVGYTHYEVWKSDVIASWLTAIQAIGALPFIVDARTFISKAMNNTLPTIDFVVNLNNGNSNLSTLTLVPSVCSFLSIPCIPCDSVSIVLGEHKGAANLLASQIGLNVPTNLPNNDKEGIFRPYNLGSSLGVRKGSVNKDLEGLYQKFISGFDVTIPILYNPLHNRMETLPPVAYFPKNRKTSWFLGEDAKKSHEGYSKQSVRIDAMTKHHLIQLANHLGVHTFCRVDTRIRCESFEEAEEIVKSEIPFEIINFIEINPMPTVKEGINFHTSIESLNESDSFYTCFQQYQEYTRPDSVSLTGLILVCAISGLSAAIATH